jgi:YHS domain-containing protein
MLRKELVIGYGVAGFLAVFVSHDLWARLFFQGHGGWTTVENVVVGPVIAFLSFVCSIGNVPLAAALWHGGISFGGVISFVFADLLTLPLFLVYRKYYGTGLAVRLSLTFWAVMATAGLAVEAIFAAVGWIPERAHGEVVHARLEWNYTTWLNLVFLVAFGVLFWLHRHRERFGGGHGYAIDPVCGMQVQIANAPATSTVGGGTTWFCSDRCKKRFENDRGRHPQGAPASAHDRCSGQAE